MTVMEVQFDPREEAYSFSDEEDTEWLCGECGEVRYEDARVEAGLKCGHCAYDGFDY